MGALVRGSYLSPVAGRLQALPPEHWLWPSNIGRTWRWWLDHSALGKTWPDRNDLCRGGLIRAWRLLVTSASGCCWLARRVSAEGIRSWGWVDPVLRTRCRNAFRHFQPRSWPQCLWTWKEVTPIIGGWYRGVRADTRGLWPCNWGEECGLWGRDRGDACHIGVDSGGDGVEQSSNV